MMLLHRNCLLCQYGVLVIIVMLSFLKVYSVNTIFDSLWRVLFMAFLYLCSTPIQIHEGNVNEVIKTVI